jgi:hypothetical protein
MHIALILLLLSLNGVYAKGGNGVIEIKNSGFEEIGRDGLPEGWFVEIKDLAKESRVYIDKKEKHSGEGSLFVEAIDANSVTVISDEIGLELGKIYKLSGWVKAEGLYSDPTSRYPTAVASCLTLASFPFTNNSTTVGGNTDWTEAYVYFIATQKRDRIRLHLGYNGTAVGKVWFDDIKIEEVKDITEVIPLETVKWYGSAYKYEDRGWIFMHIEGEPYQRGYQHGYLLANEISDYIEKLAVMANDKDPEKGWEDMRFQADTLMLRKYDKEFLTEMRGIADGAKAAGAKFKDRDIDFIDIVTVNSVIDIGQIHSAIKVTPHPLSGISFREEEDELNRAAGLHKCSGFVATAPATANGRFVFGQIFMWYGYPGVHFNILLDVQPSEGNRFVYETFPGGIHSGTDIYINSAGIVIGETTVFQTPFNINGTPQSNRIRKAAQYANSIDEVVSILVENNNGLYTNDWLIADAKTDEIAILLLGTNHYKLWRSIMKEYPGGTEGFLWSNNNAKDYNVRKEFVLDPENVPKDFIFTPWNRDVEFVDFYNKYKGKIDAIAGVNLWATSPMNRPHACDGKITTAEMAEKLMFLAHFGKVTLREKIPGISGRLMPDLPDALPHLSLGYSVVDPIIVSEKLKEAKSKLSPSDKPKNPPCEFDYGNLKDFLAFEQRLLWYNTVYPASSSENWFVSASAAYWQILQKMPKEPQEAIKHLKTSLSDLNYRFLYLANRENEIAPLQAKTVYDKYGHYQFPKIKGIALLHQLHLHLGNDTFSKLMNAIHNRYAYKEMTTQDFINVANEISKQKLDSFILQWLQRTGLPALSANAQLKGSDNKWKLEITINQQKPIYHFYTTISIETPKKTYFKIIEVKAEKNIFKFDIGEKPIQISINTLSDVPVLLPNFYSFSNLLDEFHSLIIIYGTARQIEANHTLALRYQTLLADSYTEILPQIKKDSEVTLSEASSHDLIILGHPSDNSFFNKIADKIPITFKHNMFIYDEKIFAEPDDGLIIALPNPFNTNKIIYLVIANSALELYKMTSKFYRNYNYAIFKGDKIVEEGFKTLPPIKIK